jgi:hypothetical protein
VPQTPTLSTSMPADAGVISRGLIANHKSGGTMTNSDTSPPRRHRLPVRGADALGSIGSAEEEKKKAARKSRRSE